LRRFPPPADRRPDSLHAAGVPVTGANKCELPRRWTCLPVVVCPQQATEPSWRIAQLCFNPALTMR
jgi:hypothetical protein